MLEKEDRVALVLVLLKQLQPYLSANNLSTAPTSFMQTQSMQQPQKGHHQRGGSHFVSSGGQPFSPNHASNGAASGPHDSAVKARADEMMR